MGKINFYISMFPQGEIITSEFQKLQQSLGKKYYFQWTENSFTFPLDRNLRSYLTEKLFSQPEYLTNYKNRFSLARKKFLLGSKKIFFKNCLPSFDNGFHKQKTMNERILFHLDREVF